MTQVDFYFNALDLLQVSQRLIVKALKAKVNATVVVSADLSTLHALDIHLWQFDATSFIPHVFASDALAFKTPVLLTSGKEALPHSHYGLLINCGLDVPEHFARFDRVLELVAGDESSLVAGRERFKFYKQRGYPMWQPVDFSKKPLSP